MNTKKLKPLSEVDLRDEECINEIIKFISWLNCGAGIAPEDVTEFARCVIDLAKERFEPIVAANEREECAKIAEDFAGDCWIGDSAWEAKKQIAAAIRARGKA